MPNTSDGRSVMISVETNGKWFGLVFDIHCAANIPATAHFLDDEYDLLIDQAFPWIALRTPKL